jgi:hypothetical protein
VSLNHLEHLDTVVLILRRSDRLQHTEKPLNLPVGERFIQDVLPLLHHVEQMPSGKFALTKVTETLVHGDQQHLSYVV